MTPSGREPYPFWYRKTSAILFDKSDEQRHYCSELVWHAYMQGGVDLDSGGNWLISPDDEYYSPHLAPTYIWGHRVFLPLVARQ